MVYPAEFVNRPAKWANSTAPTIHAGAGYLRRAAFQSILPVPHSQVHSGPPFVIPQFLPSIARLFSLAIQPPGRYITTAAINCLEIYHLARNAQSVFARTIGFGIILSTAAACTNPFTTRQPETPEHGGLSFIPARTPEVVLINLRNAILEQNLENYLRSLGDTTRLAQGYTYIPDAGVASENPGVFERWSLENERRYFSQLRALLPDDSLRNLSLQPVQNTQFADSALFIENYTLTVRHLQQSRGVPAVFRGQARFFLAADQFGDWAIYRWEDRATGEAPTWSLLKATYGN